MSPNDYRYVTVGAGNRALRSNDPRPNCAGTKPCRGRKPEHGFVEAEPPTGGEAHTVCYATFVGHNYIPNYVVSYLYEDLKKVRFFWELFEDGTTKITAGAKKGNAIYAWREEKRLKEKIRELGNDTERILFITLTHMYVKTEKGRRESWEYFQKEVPKFLRTLKRVGGMDFCIDVKEAHFDGGCHVHILCKFNRKLKTKEWKGKKILVSRKLHDLIKANWNGQVEIEGIRDKKIDGYLTKYLGKYSHIENALKRAKRNWENEGDEKHIDTDCKKLWTAYYCKTLSIRQVNSSRCKGKPENETRAEPADLIIQMNNSTKEEKPKVIGSGFLATYIIRDKRFNPYSGKVEKEREDYELLSTYINKKIAEREQNKGWANEIAKEIEKTRGKNEYWIKRIR